eukprot:7455277-Ditylum_brightwellii.AAC.1
MILYKLHQTQQNNSNRCMRIGQTDSKSITSAIDNSGDQKKWKQQKQLQEKVANASSKISTVEATTTTMLNATEDNAEMEDTHFSTKEKMSKQATAAIE